MIEMPWLHHFSNETLAEGIAYANELGWYLSVNTDGKRWVIRSGSSAILQTDNKEVADAFLYAFGLAYSIIPESLFAELRTAIEIETGPD